MWNDMLSLSMMWSDTESDDDDILMLLFLYLKNKRRIRNIRARKRREYRENQRLRREQTLKEDEFYTKIRMSKVCFEELYEILKSEITKQNTNWKCTIDSKERLAICLRYLATGESHQTIASCFQVGRSTVGSIIKEVCISIWKLLQPIYLPTPDENTWMQAEVGFRKMWNFPNCIGVIDGKHIPIKCANSGSEQFSNKTVDSIDLFVIVDPLYKFLVVDIGNYGRHTDSDLFQLSNLYREYIQNRTILPPKSLPGTNEPVPHVLIGDKGFALESNLMRPFPMSTVLQDERKKLFNEHLHNTRRVVENAFNLLSQEWQIFSKPVVCEIETAIDVVRATVCLHNYMRTRQQMSVVSKDEQPRVPNALINVQPHNRRSPNVALEIREKFVKYFNQNCENR